MHVNWGFALQQLLIAVLAGGMGWAAARALAATLTARAPLALRVWVELPTVTIALGFLGLMCQAMVWGQFLPGIALPFYLAHPRLMRLEKSQMLAVEGGTPRQRMMILRHEAGHAVCNAYRLHRRKRFRTLFGSVSETYPETYKPDPASREYVTHLPAWYAQAHPAEDFAETFAVWMQPGSRWWHDYEGWPVMRKLEYVDELMIEIGEEPWPRSRERPESLPRQRQRLRRPASAQWPHGWS